MKPDPEMKCPKDNVSLLTELSCPVNPVTTYPIRYHLTYPKIRRIGTHLTGYHYSMAKALSNR